MTINHDAGTGADSSPLPTHAPESSLAHTPGPWDIWTDDDGKSYSVVSLSMTTRKTICYIYGNRAQDRKKIDARLISAAPDLLEACRLLVETCNSAPPVELIKRIGDAAKAAQSALSKAGVRS